MDPRRFEELSRRVGAAANRRIAVKALAAAVAAPVLARLGAEEAAAGLPIVGCKPPGKRCKNGRGSGRSQRCCSGKCRRGICTCRKKGKSCWAPLEGALCCSGRCKSGKCG